MIPFIIRLLLGWKYNTGIYIRINVEFLRSSWEIDWLTEIETGFESVLEMFTFVIVALILVLICQLFLWLCIVIFLYTLSPAFILGGFTFYVDDPFLTIVFQFLDHILSYPLLLTWFINCSRIINVHIPFSDHNILSFFFAL